jgi:hypothetical protein
MSEQPPQRNEKGYRSLERDGFRQSHAPLQNALREYQAAILSDDGNALFDSALREIYKYGMVDPTLDEPLRYIARRLQGGRAALDRNAELMALTLQDTLLERERFCKKDETNFYRRSLGDLRVMSNNAGHIVESLQTAKVMDCFYDEDYEFDLEGKELALKIWPVLTRIEEDIGRAGKRLEGFRKSLRDILY